MNVEIIVRANKIILGILCICENSKYLKSNADTLLIECDEIICYEYCIGKNDK